MPPIVYLAELQWRPVESRGADSSSCALIVPSKQKLRNKKRGRGVRGRSIGRAFGVTIQSVRQRAPAGVP
eukprot:11213667-Lingulodinium_polyedra.AAC.1